MRQIHGCFRFMWFTADEATVLHGTTGQSKKIKYSYFKRNCLKMITWVLTPWPVWQRLAWLQQESHVCAAPQTGPLACLCCTSQSQRRLTPHWLNPHGGISVSRQKWSGRGRGKKKNRRRKMEEVKKWKSQVDSRNHIFKDMGVQSKYYCYLRLLNTFNNLKKKNRKNTWLCDKGPWLLFAYNYPNLKHTYIFKQSQF